MKILQKILQVDTPALVERLHENREIPVRDILALRSMVALLMAVSSRAIVINDEELNRLMIQLSLYDDSQSEEKQAYLHASLESEVV